MFGLCWCKISAKDLTVSNVILEKVASSDDESSGDTDEAPDVADEASEETVSDSDETKEGEETA